MTEAHMRQGGWKSCACMWRRLWRTCLGASCYSSAVASQVWMAGRAPAAPGLRGLREDKGASLKSRKASSSESPSSRKNRSWTRSMADSTEGGAWYRTTNHCSAGKEHPNLL